MRETDRRPRGVAVLGGAVDQQGIGDRRQVAGQLDRPGRLAEEASGPISLAEAEGEVDDVVADQRVGVDDGLPQRAGSGIGRRRHGEGVHQAGPLDLPGAADGEGGVDLSDAVLQRPVAAERGRSGVVGAGGEIGPGEPGEAGEQMPALVGRGQVAAVEQQVGPVGQRVVPGRDLAGAGGERVGVDPVAAELHCAIGRVRKDVHRVDRLTLGGQRLPDRRQPVARRRQQDDLAFDRRVFAGPEVRKQRVEIGQAGVDEDQLTADGVVGRRVGVGRIVFRRVGRRRAGLSRCRKRLAPGGQRMQLAGVEGERLGGEAVEVCGGQRCGIRRLGGVGCGGRRGRQEDASLQRLRDQRRRGGVGRDVSRRQDLPAAEHGVVEEAFHAELRERGQGGAQGASQP